MVSVDRVRELDFELQNTQILITFIFLTPITLIPRLGTV